MRAIRRAAAALRRIAAAAPKAGLSRRGAVRTAQRIVAVTDRPVIAKTALILVGTALVAVGASFTIRADLGTGSLDVLFTGIATQLDISIGQASWIFSAVSLTACMAVGARPGWGTAVFLAAIGFFVDSALSVVTTPDALVLRMAMPPLGIAVAAFGIATVACAGMGAGTFELLTDRAVAAGLNRIAFRTCLEGGVLALGIALGGAIGPATLFVVLATGPAITGMATLLADLRAGRDLRLGRS